MMPRYVNMAISQKPTKNGGMVKMWNKDLKSVCTYKEPRPEPLWESVAAFVVGGAAMVAWWVVLAMLTF